MCGIVGSINIPVQSDILSTIEHRGPDDQGWWEDKDVKLGHVRLSIQDVSEAGHQPMISGDGRWVMVFNGEIYNHWDIRRILETEYKIQFRSRSDTETLLYAWSVWGAKCLDKLNGIYAFGVYDTLEQKLTLVRDPAGVKPLYIYQDNTGIAFSSELKTFLKLPGFAPGLDYEAILNYLTFLWSPGEKTPFENVYKLLPGHFLEIDVNYPNDLTFNSYLPMYNEFSQNGITEEKWIDLLEEQLLTTVERQLLSDVQVGFFFSGGLDSTLLAAMAHKLHPGSHFPCFTIKTTNLAKTEGLLDDISFARKAAKHLSIDLIEIEPHPDMFNNFGSMIWQLDEPQADLAPLNVQAIAQEAKINYDCKVLIGGTGGDDVFSGYRRHRALTLENYLSWSPVLLLSGVKKILSTFPSKSIFFRRAQKLTRDWDKSVEERLLGYFNWLPDNNFGLRLLSKKVQSRIQDYNPYEYGKKLLENLPEKTPLLEQMLFLERNTFLVDHNLNYSDKMSMAVGVEARVPYLDPDLVDISKNIPVSLKLRNGQTKYILKKVAERYLPKDVIYRSKTGFGAPVRSWLKNDENKITAAFLNYARMRKQGIFNVDQVESMVTSNMNGTAEFGYNILSVMAIQSWLDQFYFKP